MHAVASESVRSSPNKVRTKSLVAHIPVSSVSKSQRALSFGILTTSPSGHLFHISPHAILRFFPYTQQCRFPLSMPSVFIRLTAESEAHHPVQHPPLREHRKSAKPVPETGEKFHARIENLRVCDVQYGGRTRSRKLVPGG